MGVAFQEAALFNSMSIRENVGLPLHELTTLSDSIIEIMTYMKLAAVGLGEAIDLMPQELSGGMKKRAAVARATALDPEILIFDEPSAGLDPIVAAGLDDLILFLKHAFHMTIMVVSHELASAFKIADRIAMLYRGSLIAVESKEAFKASTHPRIRQLLDRVADPIAESAAARDHLLRVGRISRSETMKTEAKVGAFVILCAAILLITVYKVSSAQIKGARVSYKTYLRYAGGLEPGADVLFGGITVGTVTAVHPDPQDPTRIEILFDVKLGHAHECQIHRPARIGNPGDQPRGFDHYRIERCTALAGRQRGCFTGNDQCR